MRFTRLRLNGFKSFVDPTDLVIAEGLTGVVGPNGCGKSNLLEALRWVMGETRPTQMRGGGMEDVIFAGAATRPARNFAEVALVIDNSDRLAPAGFNDSDSLEIVRRITRDAGSAYRISGREARARDVQMLFADASTGAHSPALVRQGQISDLINARPAARRAVLEEAAGIAGLYQRRHEADLKLGAAEQNLARVEDVVDQMAQQLAALARQARAAARYREIGAQLRQAEGVLLWRRWQEADSARAEAEAGFRMRLAAGAAAEAAARAATAAREAAEEQMPPLREEETIAGAVLQRALVARDALAAEEERAREAIAALEARAAQLVLDIEREAALNRDAGEVIARLEREARDLARAEEGHGARLATAAEAARAAGAVLSAGEADLGRVTEDTARLAARHQSAERLAEECRRRLSRAETEAAEAGIAMGEAERALARAGAEAEAAAGAETAATEAAARAETGLAGAEAARAEALMQEGEARARRAEAEGQVAALRAEVAALTRLVGRDGGEGVRLLDLVEVESGAELALGAALADDLQARPAADAGLSGWVVLPGYAVEPALPPGVRPLAEVVTVPPELGRRIGQIGLVDRADGPRLQPLLGPGQRLVSREGDLWRWDGLCVRAGDAPSATAQRLLQIGRLAELRRDLDAAAAEAAAAAGAHEVLARDLAALTAAEGAARQARREADRLMTEASRSRARAEADRSLAEGRCDAARLAGSRHAGDADAARAALAGAEAALAELPDLEQARAAAAGIRAAVDAARAEMMTRRSAHDGLRREGEARSRRIEAVRAETAGWQQRLATAARRTAELADRRAAAEAELALARAAPATLAGRRDEIGAAIAAAEARRTRAADALAAGEAALRETRTAEREAERAGSEAREDRARAEARLEAAREAEARAADSIREAQDATPAELLARLEADPGALPPAEAAEAQVAALRRQREALGAVNLRAEEDAREVTAGHDALVREKADLEAAIRTLRTGIASLNREGRERLLTAFEQVNENFRLLFTHLFGGGEARLVLVESDDPLEAGLEIMCQPPGKKLSTLSLLSGGEQTLTALALIFAVFLANPAPICVLDEVDAPLDDANVTRFCDLLDEMRRRTETRFLVITHHAVTMSRMDRLFGVTMAEQGVSQLVSVDLRRAESLVA